MADDSRALPDRTVEHATCLGCGCTCDDITVVGRSGRIVEARNACALGSRWFGDGAVPARVTSARSPNADVVRALADATDLLCGARRPLVYLGADISCESQRMAIAIADVVGAALDSISTAGAGAGILAAQRRGRVTATLGEIRNRADLIVFWGIDPAERYPRFTSRYAPDPVGLYVAGGRTGRRVIAVDVGSDHGPAAADARLAFAPTEEVDALTLARSASGTAAAATGPDPLEARAARLADLIRSAHYAVIVADAEASSTRDARRSEALMLLVETLNATTRCVLVSLRGGGNRSGADVTMTWQTGFPMAVDFFRGVPAYTPDQDAQALLRRRDIDVALVLGSPASLPAAVQDGLAQGVSCIAIGPRASESRYAPTVAIDTGVAGIHERGTAVRMDEMPLPLRPALEPEIVANAHGQDGGRGLVVFNGTATASALAASALPQDTYFLLRMLAASVTQMSRDGAAGAAGA